MAKKKGIQKRVYTEEEKTELKSIQDKVSEVALVGTFFKNEACYLEKYNSMNSYYDFMDDDIRELFNNYVECYENFSQDIKAETFISFMNTTEQKVHWFEEFGGWSTIEDIMKISDEKSCDTYFSRVKKFALLREYHMKGFPVKKLMAMKGFETKGPAEILTAMQYNLDKIYTDIGGGKEAILLGGDARLKLQQFKEKPDMGDPIADWGLITSMIRGLRKKKVTFLGALSNEGKSRNALYMAVHSAILSKKPTLVIMNETDENDAFLCTMTTILNNPAFGFNKKIRERNLAMGEYESDAQFNDVLEVAEFFEENTNLYFLETTRYADKDLEREIKKYVLGKKVELVVYDTMKSQDNQWETLKRTASFLKDIATDLEIPIWATFQCTDSMVDVAPHEITNNHIASAKQIRHLCDSMFVIRNVEDKFKSKYQYMQTGDDFGDMECQLQQEETYYYVKCLKNRAGSKLDTLFKVDLDYNIWEEKGFAKLK